MRYRIRITAQFFQKTKGFSLMETLVACFVLGLLVSGGLQFLHHYQDGQRMRLAQAQLYAALNGARDLAYGLRKDVWVHLAHDSGQSQPVVNLGWHLDANPRELQAVKQEALKLFVLEGVTLSSTSNPLHFAGLSGTPVGNGNITITDAQGARVKAIYHGITGRIRMCKTGSAGFGLPEC